MSQYKNNPTSQTFYFHDYETFGANPKIDRASQFAAIRTDADFNPIGEPLVLYAKPANDFLPTIDACLITGITPQQALENGVIEKDFFSAIRKEMCVSNTCSVGYNSMNFDSEVTRHGFYRNFFDAYEHEWKNNNSRWDLIDVLRTAHVFNHERFIWPTHENGKPSFRLTDFTSANNISHVGAHDALADVRATIDLAKMVKERSPKMLEYMLKLRDKHFASEQLALCRPVFHVSRSYSSIGGCVAMIMPIAYHPTNKNAIIAYNLASNPDALFDLSQEEIRRLVFTKGGDLNENEERLPLITLQTNKCPAIFPLGVMRPENAHRIGFDRGLHDANAQKIIGHKDLRQLQAKITQAFNGDMASETDPDLMIYSGGFFGNADKGLFPSIHRTGAEKLSGFAHHFSDTRLPEMLFRYRARNYLSSLSCDELQQWNSYRVARINQLSPDYQELLSERLADPLLSADNRKILIELSKYADSILPKIGEDADLAIRA